MASRPGCEAPIPAPPPGQFRFPAPIARSCRLSIQYRSVGSDRETAEMGGKPLARLSGAMLAQAECIRLLQTQISNHRVFGGLYLSPSLYDSSARRLHLFKAINRVGWSRVRLASPHIDGQA